MFASAALVRLFCLSHFPCPPPRFICAGLADVELGRGAHIFGQGGGGEWEGGREGAETARRLLTSTLNAAPVAAARCLPQPVSLRGKPAVHRVDLLDESATWKNKRHGREKKERRRRRKKKSSVSQHAGKKRNFPLRETRARGNTENQQ